MQTSIALRILSVLSESEIDELYNSLLNRIDGNKFLAAPNKKHQINHSDTKSRIAFLCRSKRLELGLGIFAIAKSAAILPSELREIEEGGDYNIDVLLKLLSFLKLKIDLVNFDSELVIKPLATVKRC